MTSRNIRATKGLPKKRFSWSAKLVVAVGTYVSPYLRHIPIQEIQYVFVRLPYLDTEGSEGARGTARGRLGRRARRRQQAAGRGGGIMNAISNIILQIVYRLLVPTSSPTTGNHV